MAGEDPEELDVTTSEPCTKRLKKTPAPILSSYPLPFSPSSKGKSKIDDESSSPATSASESESQCCGICLSEGGNARAAIRGRIDCCNHYFCFVCIMEWARVESRCPICRRRFGSIRRPPKAGVFPTERVVNVTVRDQILTVPEGDWLCHDCAVSKAEHDNVEADADCDNRMSAGSIQTTPRSEEQMSVDDIVREPVHSKVYDIDYNTERISETGPCAATSSPSVSARTLQHCRNVHFRVRAIRENWNALRSGALNFSSCLIDLGGNIGERHSERSSSCDTKHSTKSDEVDKAWKMMDKAKSMEQAYERTNNVPRQPRKHLVSKVSNSSEKSHTSSLLVLGSISCGTRHMAGNDGPHKHHSFDSHLNGNTWHKTQTLERWNQHVESKRNNSSFDVRHRPGVAAIQDPGVDSTRRISKSGQKEAPSSHPFGGSEELRFLPSVSNSFTALSGTSPAKADAPVSSKTDHLYRKDPISIGCARSKTERDDTKSNIQVLVKLSLKLLAQDRKLETKTFKEIARLSTHSILAACGLEQPEPGVRSFPTPVCSHTNNQLGQQQRRMSNIMPNCCRECFHVFVKDVVDSIMVERIGSA